MVWMLWQIRSIRLFTKAFEDNRKEIAEALEGLSDFLVKMADALQNNRKNVAEAIEDITEMISMLQGNFGELKNFIRSII